MVKIYLFYDGSGTPSGWSLESGSGDTFYQKFIKSTPSYGVAGGGNHLHKCRLVSMTGGPSGCGEATVGNFNHAPEGHKHNAEFDSGSSSSAPLYRTLKFISFTGMPSTLPAGAIAAFDVFTPSNWTRYSSQDNYCIYGREQAGITGGGSHTQVVYGDTGSSLQSIIRHRIYPGCAVALSSHLHLIDLTASAVNNAVATINTILAKANAEVEIPYGFIALFDAAPGRPWVPISGVGYPFYNRYIKGSTTFSIGDGGFHKHPNVSGTTGTATTSTTDLDTLNSPQSHVHDVTMKLDPAESDPAHVTVIAARKSISYPPKCRINGKKIDQISRINHHQKAEMDKLTYRIWQACTGMPAGNARTEAVSFVLNDKFYVGTGVVSGGVANDLWMYDPTTDSWTQKANPPGYSRYAAVGIAIGNYGYIGLGYTEEAGGGLLKSWAQYNPSNNTWTQKADFDGSARYFASAFTLGNYGYVGLGYDGAYKNDWWRYDPSSNSWVQKANFGGGVRFQASSFTIGNYGYVGVGCDSSVNKQDFWRYSENSWVQRADFPDLARAGACGYSNEKRGRGYIACGDLGFEEAIENNDCYEYNPSTNLWTPCCNYGSTDFRLRFLVGGGIDTECYMATGVKGMGGSHVLSAGMYRYTAIYLGIA